MQVRNWMLVATVATAVVSCSEAGTNAENPDSTKTTKETTTTTSRVEVPEATRSSFAAKYPQAANITWSYHEPIIVAPVEWEWTDWPAFDANDYVATFTMDDKNYWVWYDDNGEWIGTVEELNDYSSLPAPVNHTIKSQFSRYTIISVDKENDKDHTAYEIKMGNGQDNVKALIAENGQVMKKKGKESGAKTK